ncbi:PEP/pyruvate-binding domain-containing protein [Thermococcus sp.]
MFVRTLSAGCPIEEIGGKAHRLSLLTRYFNVPEGFVVTTKAYELWKETGSLSKDLIDEIKEYFHSPYVLEGRFPVVVRSSATVEDSSRASFAGVFESVTGVSSFDELIRAIERIFKSAESSRVKEYMKRLGIKGEVKMAVIVQRQVHPKLSGVLFTRSPNEPDRALVELVEGSPEKLVGGGESGKRLLLPRDPTGVKDPLMRELIETGLEVEELFRKPQDIEWAYDGTLWLLQSREVTVLAQKSEKVKESSRASQGWHRLRGVPASPGRTRGKAYFVLDDQPPEEAERVFPRGGVLVTYVLHAEYYSLFMKASAIVTKVESILSHPAIIARELGIPCVTGVDVEVIREGDEVIVDGDEGAVYIRNPRKRFRKLDLWEASWEEDELIKELKEEYLKALGELDAEKLERTILRAFEYVRKLYPVNKERAFNVYHFINTLMEDETPRILAERFSVAEVFARADRGERPRDETEERLFRIYDILKRFINYTDERIRDIPVMLFGLGKPFKPFSFSFLGG